jgi:thioredoxin reductase (NADPH)
MYDALILGGGPAGLSAAIYLGRFTRSVLVLDAGEGRSSFAQVNENYLGFPDGITTRELRDLGRRQSERFGVHFKECRVERVERIEAGFRAYTTDGDFEGRTLLLATGVTDIWPDVPDIKEWIGRQVFWCITCDGHRTPGKTLLCIGNTDEAAVTTLQLLLFTRSLTLAADPDKARFSPEVLANLDKQGVRLLYARPERLELSPDGDRIVAVRLSDGSHAECNLVFSLLGVLPNTQIAREIGVDLDRDGYVVMDEEGHTTVEGLFAAGDLTRMYTQQVASAVHSGAEAAQTMNYYLYADFQKNGRDVPEQSY